MLRCQTGWYLLALCTNTLGVVNRLLPRPDALGAPQVEVYDEEEGKPGEAEGGVGGGDGGEASSDGGPKLRVRVVLWRRDLLTGVLELDERLVVRRASAMTGLIVGLPASALLKKPLTRWVTSEHGGRGAQE